MLLQLGADILQNPERLGSVVVNHIYVHRHCFHVQRRCGDTCPFLTANEHPNGVFAPDTLTYCYKYLQPPQQ